MTPSSADDESEHHHKSEISDAQPVSPLQPQLGFVNEDFAQLDHDHLWPQQRSYLSARNVQIEARWSMTISDLVQEGLGCSIVDGFTASSFADRGGIVRRLTDRLDFAFVGITHQFSLETAVAQKFQGAFETEFDLFRTEIANRDFARSLPRSD